MAHTIPSIFLAIPSTYPSLTVPGHYTQLLSGAPVEIVLESLRHVPTVPELVVLDAAELFRSGLGTLVALKKTVAQSGATLLLTSDLSETSTAWVARASGAHAAVLGQLETDAFARLAELLLSERTNAAAAPLRKEAALQPPPHLDYLRVPA